jgi:hypothetical protein
MQTDILSLHLKMKLEKENLAGSFEMQFNLRSNVSMNEDGDMVLTIIDAIIGGVVLNNETPKSSFDVFDDTLMGDNTLIIPKETLNEMFEESGIIINDSYVINANLQLRFGLDS